MTARDKKLLLALVPIVILGGFWFVILGPKRAELSKASATLAKAQQRRDSAVAKANELEAARAGFSADYKAVLHLGKAIPSTLDMPSLIVQLDAAARGTGIKFNKIDASGESGPGGSKPASGGGQSTSQPPASPAGKAAAGGAKAQTGPGRATESAGNAVNGANAKSAAADQPGGGKTATGSSPGAPGAGTEAPGLTSVPLSFSFSGSFVHLANFLHRLKRSVQVVNGRLQVRGRLMTVDSFTFTSGDSFPSLIAEVSATVYLVPKSEGVSGGATPAGPRAQQASTPAGGSNPPVPPTAAATP